MPRLTIFSWGYDGWGRSMREFVRGVDALERRRGFKPPIFVDVRFNRSVRARDLYQKRLENQVGLARYRWMPGLGNENIKNRAPKAKRMKIKEPSVAEYLLDVAIWAAQDRRRVIFFCNCPYQRWGAKTKCHRFLVGNLLLRAAKRRRTPLTVVEWPGEAPIQARLKPDPHVTAALDRRSNRIPLASQPRIDRWFGLPWGSIVEAPDPEEESWFVVSGPAFRYGRNWFLPADSWAVRSRRSWLRANARKLRRHHAYNPRTI